jgi:hypothetical protein
VCTDLETIWAYLGVEPAQGIALSAILNTAGEPSLMAASLLVGPDAIAQGWPAWRLAEASSPCHPKT